MTWVENSFCAIPDSKLQIPEMIRANSLSDHEKCLTDRFHTGNPVPEMPYRKFEDLPVWKGAAHLAQSIFELTSEGVFRNHSASVQAFAVSGISTLSLRRDLPNRLRTTYLRRSEKLAADSFNLEFAI
jgi:hypothetical protein